MAPGWGGVSGTASRALKGQGAGSEPFSWSSSTSLSLEADQRGAKSVRGWRQQWPLGAGPDSASGLGRPWTQ